VTLLHALARVRRERDVRLVVLGRGPLRERLSELAAELGVGEAVRMPGVVANPFAYLARASAFVLSSAWEGLPNVLLEALACGCPVVATDCPSGPREILADGRHGRLVPVADPEALAAAILATLDAPPDPGPLRARAADFALARSADRYLEVLLGSDRAHAVTAPDGDPARAPVAAASGSTA
jgi:glycosyltransferase involved in cell wall biosynthesis